MIRARLPQEDSPPNKDRTKKSWLPSIWVNSHILTYFFSPMPVNPSKRTWLPSGSHFAFLLTSRC